MSIKTFGKLAVAPWLCVLLMSCGSDSEPVDPDITMAQDESYSVVAHDRLVNTSPEPAKVRVVFELNENTGTTHAEVTLLDGTADLFR